MHSMLRRPLQQATLPRQLRRLSTVTDPAATASPTPSSSRVHRVHPTPKPSMMASLTRPPPRVVRLPKHAAVAKVPSRPHDLAGTRPSHADSPSLPYFVPRNSNNQLPVYTDIRKGGTKKLTWIRNIQGNIVALQSELRSTLFDRESPETSRMRCEIRQNRHLVVDGGLWPQQIMEWLQKRGF